MAKLSNFEDTKSLRTEEMGRGKATTIVGIIAFLFLVIFILALCFGAGVDWFLASVMGIVILLLFATNTYLVWKWADPEDQASSICVTLLIIFSMSVAGGAILGLPLDVANNSNSLECKGVMANGGGAVCGGMNMTVFWEAIVVLIFLCTVIFIPTAIFQYESYDAPAIRKRRNKGNDNQKAIRIALCYETHVLVATFLTLCLMYAFLGTSEVPVTTMRNSVNLMSNYTTARTNSISVSQYFGDGSISKLGTTEMTNTLKASSSDDVIEISSSFLTYTFALTSFVGWFFFVLFGGIGISALPVTLINTYIDRPKIMTTHELVKEKDNIIEKAKEYQDIGKQIKEDREEWANGKRRGWLETRQKNNEVRTNVNKYAQMVLLLENQHEHYLLSQQNKKDSTPLRRLWPYISLVLGCISVILSLLWILHIGLYMLPEEPVSLFLNAYLIQFEYWFPLFGILSVALFAGYLLLCVIFGLFKVGIRFFCLTLHPMRYGKTLMNSFLFNVGMIMLNALPVVQFCTMAFDSYARYTTISSLLGVQVKYLKFFKYFFEENVFVWVFLALAVLSALYVMIYRHDKPADSKEIKDILKRKK